MQHDLHTESADELYRRETAIGELLRDRSERELAAELAAAAAAVRPVAGPIFSPESFLAFSDVLPPWDRRAVIRLYKPRFIGSVRNGGAHPASLEPNVGWIPFGQSLENAAAYGGQAVAAHPRLAFVKGWGSPTSRLYGTCLVTHYRRGRLGVAYVALQRIDPASDPASNAAGLSQHCFEEPARNVNFIAAAIGSVDLAGTALTRRDQSAAGELSLFMHWNDSGRYSVDVLALRDIDRLQAYSTGTLTPDERLATPSADAGSPVDQQQAQAARRHYTQVIRALQMARASSADFDKLALANGALRVLMQEDVARAGGGGGGATELEDAYLPQYGGDSNGSLLGSLKPFSLDTGYY